MRFWETIVSTSVQTCTMQGRSAFEYVGEATQSWMAVRSSPSQVPEHIYLHPDAALLAFDLGFVGG
jgi:hypothetical protein